MNRQAPHNPDDGQRKFFLNTGLLQGIAEASALALILVLGVYVSLSGVSGQTPLQVLVIGPLAAMYCAARMRLATGGLRSNLLQELLVGASLALTITLLAMPVITADTVTNAANEMAFFTVFLTVWTFGAFLVFRALAYFWPVWVRLRRSRLRWEMTHATLMVVAPVSALVIVVLVLFILAGAQFAYLDSDVSILGRVMSILPALGILIFLTVVGLAFLLPPAAIISYFSARNTASRLEALSLGTSGLREGNLTVRVQVDGQDEISDVQRDFNLMADNLEHLVHDLRSERDNVERLLNTQRELVANVSHELRTPVATMRGYLESALNEHDDHDPQQLRHDLEIMSREVVRLQRLIDDLFILSRAEAGQLPLEIQPANIAALVTRTVAAVTEGAWRTGRVEVIEDIMPGLPQAMVDTGRLEQAIRNLLSNAVRHTPPGGIVAVSARPEDGMVVIEVKDTGQGIAPEKLDAIFERFYRLDDARQRDPAGAGLGLALVKELTEAMGGRVTVASEPGMGSRFTLYLPIA